MSEEKTFSQSHPDWETLRRSYRFEGMGEEEKREEREIKWQNVSQIRDIVSRSEVMKRGLPVYYPGAAFDVAYPLAFTDSINFIFMDYVYIDEKGELRQDELPDNEIERIGGIVTSVEHEGILGQGGKRIVHFDWGGKERKIIMYAEDATSFTPEEIKNGIAFIVIKAPTAFARSRGGAHPGNIAREENIARLYKSLSIDGFIHWDPSLYFLSHKPAVSAVDLGFKRLIEDSFAKERTGDPWLDRQKPYGYDLYQKVKQPNLPLQSLT